MQLKNFIRIPAWPELEMLGMHMEVNGEEPTKVEHVQSGDQNHKSLVHRPSKKHLSGRKNVK